MTTTVIKPYRLLLLGVAVSLTLPLFGCNKKTSLSPVYASYGSRNANNAQKPLGSAIQKFDKNNDGVFDRSDWKKLKDDEKRTFARMSLEDIGENPSTTVSQDKTREDLLIEGLEAIYGK